MPMMGSTPAGAGPEAGVYEALAAAVSDPQEFAKRLKQLAEETRKHQAARDAAITAQNAAIEARKGAESAIEEAQAAIAEQTEWEGALAQKLATLKAERGDFEEERRNSWKSIEEKTGALNKWYDDLEAREKDIGKAEEKTRLDLGTAEKAKRDFEAKRDRLLKAME